MSVRNSLPPQPLRRCRAILLRFYLGAVVCLILAIHAGLVSWSAARQSPTIDEPVHIAAGVRHWQEGRRDLNRGNPPLVDLVAAIPVVFANPKVDWARMPSSFHVAGDFGEANGSRTIWLTTIARWALLPFSLLGGYVCFLWARGLFGRQAGVLALGLWSFCPLIIANAEIVTGDLTSTSFILLTCYSFWRWLRQPVMTHVVLTGLAWGLAESTKFVAVVLYGVLPLLWLLTRMKLHRSLFDWRQLRRELGHGLVMVFLSVYVINWLYLFDGTGIPLSQFEAGRRLAAVVGVREEGGGGWLLATPVPLPADYLGGIDEISRVFKVQYRTYLAGEWKAGGWWYYYLAALGVKMPIGILVVFAVSLVLFVIDRQLRTGWRNELALLFPGLFLLAFVSHQTTVQYLRYALPFVPFAMILSSRIAKSLGRATVFRGVIVVVGSAWTLVSALSVYPHSGSYFNELAGGPRNGHAYLLESSIDWGQDLLYLKRWLDQHPEVDNFQFAYFGHFDPRHVGIQFSLPASAPKRVDDLAKIELRPGWYAISVSLLRGYGWPTVPDGTGGISYVAPDDYQFFLNCTPTARAGYSINLYHITNEQTAEVLRTRKHRL